MRDDTISRQAAIDELKRISFSHWFECGEYLSEDTREIEIISSSKALEVIEALPSAQPEQRWIPVTERLPEENTPVLLGVRFKDDFKYFVTARVDYNYWTGLGRDIRGELAWMPLPKPWKEGNG